MQAFISVRLLETPDPLVHTLRDDMESAFWVLVYQALLYLKHSMDPLVLRKYMQLIFYTPTRNGSVVDGDSKLILLLHCSRHQSAQRLTRFKKPGVNTFLNELGKLFFDGYYPIQPNESHPNLDDPDEKWFPNFLRQTSSRMEPLCVTPTGLKSPTNDSQPPDDPTKWEPANFSIIDYYLMPTVGIQEFHQSTEAARERFNINMFAQIHGMDGSLISFSKPAHIGEAEDEEDEDEDEEEGEEEREEDEEEEEREEDEEEEDEEKEDEEGEPLSKKHK